MQLLTPAGLGLLALAIPILLLYMLKLRRKPVQVSSTLLWERMLRDQQANTPWQKLKRNLLLFLQLLILTALALALARPALITPVVASGSVIVLLDASASMNATDIRPSRFENARRAAQTILNSLSNGAQMTLILVGDTPQTLISAETDQTLLGSALAAAQPSQGSANWPNAFALAAGAAQNSPNVTFIILSDGGLPATGLPALPGQVRYVPIGTSADNLAISALALRSDQLFAEITNYSVSHRATLLSIYFNDELLTARLLELDAGASQSLSLTQLPTTPGLYRAQISSPQTATALDVLPLDDLAFAVNQDAATRRVLLVSKGNLYLEQLLASLPGLQPFRALPAADGTLQLPSDPFDLYIFDGLLPAAWPNGSLLLINPASNPFFEVGLPFSEMTNLNIRAHPLTRYVDWSNVHILQAKTIQPPAWADALIESNAGPLVFAGQTANRRIASLAFDLRESDLPLQVAYPILFSNLINYLVPPAAFDTTQALQPGQPLTIIPPPGVEKIVIASPSNQAYVLLPSAASLSFTNTAETGYYAVNFISNDSTQVDYFAVNLFNPTESDIQPRQSLQIGQNAIQPAPANQIGLSEIWPWLAALALLVLIVEWQVYHRRTLPGPKSGDK